MNNTRVQPAKRDTVRSTVREAVMRARSKRIRRQLAGLNIRRHGPGSAQRFRGSGFKEAVQTGAGAA